MASNNLTPSEVNAIYSGIYGPANNARMQTMETPKQIYSGFYGPATTAAVKAINKAAPHAAQPTAQPNFYSSPGVSPSFVNTIGQPLSPTVNQNGQRIVGGPPGPTKPLDNWNGDPAYLAYMKAQTNQPNQPTDWSKANPGSTGLFGMPMSPNQKPQSLPTAPLPIMSRTALPVPAAAPVQAPAPAVMPIMAATNGYQYSPVAGGGFSHVGQVNPTLNPAQVYAAANAQNTAQTSSNPRFWSTDNGGGGNGSLV